MYSVVLIVIGSLLGAFGAYFLKLAGKKTNNLIEYFITPFFYLGGFLYFLASILNIICLKYLPYSIVLPMTSITYLWTLGISYFLLKEKLNRYHFFGVGFILFGILILGIVAGKGIS